MKKIAYSISASGGGHISRNKPLIEWLLGFAEVHVFSSHRTYDAYNILFEHNKNFHLHMIEGVQYHFENGKLSFRKTGFSFVKKIPSYLKSIKDIENFIQKANFDLIISDWEPILSRAVKNTKIPVIHINHHPAIADKERKIPFVPWGIQHLMKRAIASFMPKPNTLLLNAFYTTSKRNNHEIGIGSIIRNEITSATPESREHTLVYLKHSIKDALFPLLFADTKNQYLIYTQDPKNFPPASHIVYKRLSFEKGFVNDLKSAKSVIGASGLDLPTECLHLNKPMLMIAEQKQIEQYVNGAEFEKLGAGTWTPIQLMSKAHLEKFHNNYNTYKSTLNTFTLKSGLPYAKEVIMSYLDKKPMTL